MNANKIFGAPNKDPDSGLLYQKMWGNILFGSGTLAVQYW